MPDLELSYHDVGQRLEVRGHISSRDAAVLQAVAETCPEGWRLFALQLKARPKRGARVVVECTWVSQEWWHRKREEAGRS